MQRGFCDRMDERIERNGNKIVRDETTKCAQIKWTYTKSFWRCDTRSSQCIPIPLIGFYFQFSFVNRFVLVPDCAYAFVYLISFYFALVVYCCCFFLASHAQYTLKCAVDSHILCDLFIIYTYFVGFVCSLWCYSLLMYYYYFFSYFFFPFILPLLL